MRKGFHINSNFQAEIDIKIRDRGGWYPINYSGRSRAKRKIKDK